MNLFSTKKNKFEELKKELKNLQSSLKVNDGFCEWKNRMNQFYGYEMIDFWENGICLQVNTKIKDPKQLAELIYAWCEQRLTGEEIKKKIPGFELTKKLKLATQSSDDFLIDNWTDIKKYNEEFTPLIDLLMNDPRTMYLMAFRQLFDLGLSRFIGEWNRKLINDLPRIRMTDDKRYKIMTPEQAFKRDMDFTNNYPENYLGIGNAKEAFEIILANLPSHDIRAKYMTEKDWDDCASQRSE